MPIQQFMDQHGTWRGNDYLVYCGPAMGGGWADARELTSITAVFGQVAFTRPLSDLERMNDGRTFYVDYHVHFRYIRDYNGLYHKWMNWSAPGEAAYRVTLRTTASRKNVITDVSDNNSPGANRLCSNASKPTTAPPGGW